MENVAQKNEKSIARAIKIDEKEIGDHLNQLVRQAVKHNQRPTDAAGFCALSKYLSASFFSPRLRWKTPKL